MIFLIAGSHVSSTRFMNVFDHLVFVAVTLSMVSISLIFLLQGDVSLV